MHSTLYSFFVFARVFSKFKDAVRLIPATIRPDTVLDRNSARDLFPGIQSIYGYVKVGDSRSLPSLATAFA